MRVQNKDREKITELYLIVKESDQNHGKEIISDLSSFFNELPEWISRVFVSLIESNGIEKLEDTYRYLNDLVSKWGIMNNDRDKTREATLNACINAKKYIKNILT